MTTCSLCATVRRAALLSILISPIASADGPADQEPPPPVPQKPRPVYKSNSPSTNRHPDRPSYVKTFDHYTNDEDMSWLEFGIEQRTRF